MAPVVYSSTRSSFRKIYISQRRPPFKLSFNVQTVNIIHMFSFNSTNSFNLSISRFKITFYCRQIETFICLVKQCLDTLSVFILCAIIVYIPIQQRYGWMAIIYVYIERCCRLLRTAFTHLFMLCLCSVAFIHWVCSARDTPNKFCYAQSEPVKHINLNCE